MEISSYVTGAAMAVSNVQTGFAVGIAVTKKAMESQEVQARALLELMAQGPSFGHRLDIRV